MKAIFNPASGPLRRDFFSFDTEILNRKSLAFCLLPFAFCLGLVLPARAWNDTGHMLVAAIAHHEFKATEQAALDALLQNHTSHTGWVNGFNTLHPGVPVGVWTFMQAALWPDDIRNYTNPATRANQHFVDFPLRPPKYSTNVSTPNPTDNVIFGITACGDIVADLHANKRDTAESLSFLIHFVGDIHQPLHCSTLFNKPFPKPQGDRGGTYFYVKTNTDSVHGTKLHGIWDSLLGKGTNAQDIVQRAGTLTSTFPRAHFGATVIDKTTLQWSKESRDLAREKGYKPLPALDGTNGNPILLPPHYTDDAQALAEERITLAGYRLADRLRAILTARGDIP